MDQIKGYSRGGLDHNAKLEIKKEFSTKIYSLMMANNLSQSDLARSAGVGRDSISQYVRGRSLPSPKTAAKIAKALKVDIQELYPASKHYEDPQTGKGFSITHLEDDPKMARVVINIDKKIPLATAQEMFALYTSKYINTT